MADAILAAGYRKAVEPVVTDQAVEAAYWEAENLHGHAPSCGDGQFRCECGHVADAAGIDRHVVRVELTAALPYLWGGV